MNRAFVVLDHERRREGTRRETWVSPPVNGESREIPIKYPNGDRGPIVTTTIKFIGFLIIYTTAVVAVSTVVYANIVDARFDRFELRLTKEYASHQETGELLPRKEYELRHAELIQRDAQLTDRINALEERLNRLNESLGRNGKGK